MRGRRKYKGRLPRLLLLFGCFMATWLWYVNSVYIQPLVIAKTQESLRDIFADHRIWYKSIKWHPLTGLRIKDLSIYQAESIAENPREAETLKLILHAPDTVVRLSAVRYLKDRAIHISRINIKKFTLHLCREKNGHINILSPPLIDMDRIKNRSEITGLGTINLMHGKVIIRDNFINPFQRRILKDVQGKINIDLGKKRILFDNSFILDEHSSSCRLKGLYFLRDDGTPLLRGRISATPFPLSYLSAYHPLVKKIKKLSGYLSINAFYTLSDWKKLSMQGKFDCSNFMYSNDRITFGGNLSSFVHMEYDIDKKEFSSRTAAVKISQINILKPEALQIVKNLALEGFLHKDALRIHLLRARLGGHILKGGGLVRQITNNPYVKLSFRHSADELLLKDIFRAATRNPAPGINLQGQVSMDYHIEGPIDQKLDLETRCMMTLEDNTLSWGPYKSKLTNIAGKILFSRKLISVPGISFMYKNNTGKLTGEYSLIDHNGSFSAAAPVYDLSTDFAYEPVLSRIIIQSLKGKVSNSDINAHGKISQLDHPSINLRMNVSAQAGDLSALLPDKYVSLAELKGWIELSGDIIGPLNQPQMLALRFESESSALNFKDIEFRQFRAKGSVFADRFIIDSIDADLFGGKLHAVVDGNHIKEDTVFTGSVELSDLSIKEISKINAETSEPPEGILSGHCQLRGLLSKAESVSGQARIEITNGNLGPLPFVNPLLGPFEKMFFGHDTYLEEAYGDFTISEKHIYTDNFKFWGDRATLLFKGNADFSGKLDFVIENSVSEGLINKSGSLGGMFGSMFDRTRKILGRTKIEGELESPVFRYEILPSKRSQPKTF